MRGRHTSLRPRLTIHQHIFLTHLRDSAAVSPAVLRRVRLILLVSSGLTISAAAAQVRITRPHAYKWLKRWQQEGETGLKTRPPGRKRGTGR